MTKKPIHPPGAAKPIAPYTPAMEAGGFVFISGQVAFKGASGELALGSIEEETTQVMENIGILLRAAGLGYEHLVKVTIFPVSYTHLTLRRAI